MFGLDSSEIEFSYDWKNASYYFKIVKPAPTSRKAAPRTAEIMLSPAGQKAFLDWSQSSFGKSGDFGAMAISPELEAAYNADDPDAAIQIAKLGQRRLSSYMKSILGGGEKFRESAIHIQRWWAVNVKGEAVYGDVAKKINALVQAGDAKSIIEWAKLLQGLLKERQFVINPIRVRSEGTLYGTVDVNKRKIYRSLQKYSAILEKLVVPIYQEMDNLTNQINGYYLQNRVGDAFKASGTAQKLVGHTSQLSEEAKK